MKGFHGNLCVPVTKVALHIPWASFLWTLKAGSLAAESLTLGRPGCIGFGMGEREGRGKALLLELGSQATLETPLDPFCRLLTPCSGQGPSQPCPSLLACLLPHAASGRLEDALTGSPFRVVVMTCMYRLPSSPHGAWSRGGPSECQRSLLSSALGVRTPGLPLRPAAWHVTWRQSLSSS